MSLRLRHLRLVAETPEGPHGVDLPLRDGLVVLRADNTSGKSTCVQAIVYALGLEAMLTVRHEVPLPHAMTDRVESGGGELPVLESYVLLEVENENGNSLTVQRWAKSETHEINLIRTWEGPALTQPGGAWLQRDTFTRQRGAAQRQAGFHRTLEQFLGWSLPRFPGADGSETQLYLEQVFPLFFVEQKRGWAGIQAQMPPYAGIPDVRSRALEFVLSLDVYERTARRTVLENQVARVEEAWSQHIALLKQQLDGTGVVLQGLPDTPQVEWPPEVPPVLLVAAGDEWRGLDDTLQDLSDQISELEARAVPTADEAAGDTSERLLANERELGQVAEAYAELTRQAKRDEGQLDALDRRIEALDEDIRESRDAVTLATLGAAAGAPEESDECPTCHRALPATIAVETGVGETMTLEENLSFLGEQKKTFEGMKRVLRGTLEATLERHAAIRQRMDELRATIRADRQALVSPAGNPDVAVLQERLLLGQRRDELTRLQQRLASLLLELEPLAGEWAGLKGQLSEIPTVRLSEDDSQKLRRLEQSLIAQLEEYGFSSFDRADEVEISDLNYRPAREGYDLGFDLSASDWIRLIWAYLLGLLELDREEETNHPGLLVFDEPRQQDAAEYSLASLIARAGQASDAGQQILFATSEELGPLELMLEAAPGAQLIAFEGKILQPMSSER